MQKYKLMLLSTLFILMSCAPPLKRGMPPINLTTQIRHYPDFTELAIKGNMSIEIQTGYPNQLIFKGDESDLENIKVNNKGNRLIIEGPNQSLQPIQIQINTTYLNFLYFKGNGVINAPSMQTSLIDMDIATDGYLSIQGKIGLKHLLVRGKGETTIDGIQSSDLNIVMRDSPRVYLSGVAGLKSVHYQGNGWLGFYWVKSSELEIIGNGNAYLQLAGITKKLVVSLQDHAYFNGRYLRADYTFVKTKNSSIAEITTLKKQHSLATDSSTIYYYNNTDMETDFMGFNGAVLNRKEAILFN